MLGEPLGNRKKSFALENSPLIAIDDDFKLLDNTEFHVLLVVSSGGCDTWLFELRRQIISDIACPGQFHQYPGPK